MAGGYQVVDHNDVVVARVYGRDDIHALNPGTLTAREAQRFAHWIARLPELIALARGDPPEGQPDGRKLLPAWAPDVRKHGLRRDE